MTSFWQIGSLRSIFKIDFSFKRAYFLVSQFRQRVPRAWRNRTPLVREPKLLCVVSKLLELLAMLLQWC